MPEYRIIVNLETDTPEALEDYVSSINLTAPYFFDNVDVVAEEV